MRTLKAFIRSFFENILGTENRFLFFSWSIAVILILVLGLFLNTESVSILGLAESHEFQVNFDRPVEIKHIHVLPSQLVKKGDLLIELSQEDLNQQLRTLKARYERLSAELNLRRQISSVASNTKQLDLHADPLQTDIKDVKREISFVENRLRNLFVFAEVDGAVGAVNYKPGETAPAFAPLITLIPINPSYINGYVNENLHAAIKVGQLVDVSTGDGRSVYGKIASIGSRIVPIPQRLLRIYSLPAWGREVVIKIPSNNKFLVGEKVTVKKNWGVNFLNTAQAKEEIVNSIYAENEPQNMRYPSFVTDQFEPEISGIVYIPDLKKYALISDDYPESRPFLLLMNENGEISEQFLPIEGLDKMEDIESISIDGNHIYLMSSLSVNKNSQLKKHRQLFAKIKRNGFDFKLERIFDLRKALLSALKNSSTRILNEIYQKALEQDLEIEGHFVKDNTLHVALKQPVLANGESVVLQLRNVGELFNKENLDPGDLKMAFKFRTQFVHHATSESVLTDLISIGDTVYAASSCKSDKCSAVWKLNDKEPELIYEFDERRLEGIAKSPDGSYMYGVFDHQKRSKFVMFPNKAVKGKE